MAAHCSLLAGRDILLPLPARHRPRALRVTGRGSCVRFLWVHGSPLRPPADGARCHLDTVGAALVEPRPQDAGPGRVGVGDSRRAVHGDVAARGPRADFRLRPDGGRAAVAHIAVRAEGGHKRSACPAGKRRCDSDSKRHRPLDSQRLAGCGARAGDRRGATAPKPRTQHPISAFGPELRGSNCFPSATHHAPQPFLAQSLRQQPNQLLLRRLADH